MKILTSISLTLAFTSICGFAWAASQTDKDLAAAQAQVRDLRLQLGAANQRDIDNRAALVKLQAQMAARSKDAAVATKSAAVGRDVAADAAMSARETATATTNAVVGVQDSANSIQLQLAELKAQQPLNSVAVWLSAIAAIGALIGTLGSIALAVINHVKVVKVEKQTDGMVGKIAAMSESKGRADAMAEIASKGI
jgi:hypothetical protein